MALLVVVGVVTGAFVGYLGAALVLHFACMHSLECMGGLYVLAVAVPGGAIAGGTIGAAIGARQPSRTNVDGSKPTPIQGSGTPNRRRETASAWLAVIGGLMAVFGTYIGWRIVQLSPHEIDRSIEILTPGPESLGFLGGVFAVVAGALRTLRPSAAAPTVILGIGATIAVAGVIWGFVDVAGIPGRFQPRLLPGIWWTSLGGVLALVGWVVDRRSGKAVLMTV